MTHTLLLAVHVTAGLLALGLGPAAVLLHRSRVRLAAPSAYLVAISVLTTSAIGLVALAPLRLWWLLPIAGVTQLAASIGWASREATSPRAEGWRVRLNGGSYVSLVTALLVVSWGGIVSWLLPSAVGVVVVEAAAARAARRRQHERLRPAQRAAPRVLDRPSDHTVQAVSRRTRCHGVSDAASPPRQRHALRVRCGRRLAGDRHRAR